MKKILIFFCFISLTLNAQKSETRSTGNFDKIRSVSGGHIVYHLSEVPKVVVEYTEAADLKEVETRTENKTLVIKIPKAEKKPHLKNLKIHVYGNTLQKIEVGSGTAFKIQDELHLTSLNLVQNGSCEVDMGPGLHVKDLKVDIQSHAILKGNVISENISGLIKTYSIWESNIKTDNIRLDIQKSSIVSLEGNAQKIYLNVTGSSIANTLKLTALKAELISEGSSVVESWVTGSLNAKAQNTSQILIKGEPDFTGITTRNMGLIANKNGKTYSNTF